MTLTGSNIISGKYNTPFDAKNSHEPAPSLFRHDNYPAHYNSANPGSISPTSSFFPPNPPPTSAVYNANSSWSQVPPTGAQSPNKGTPTTPNSNFESPFFGGNSSPMSWLPQNISTQGGNFGENSSQMPFPFPGGQGSNQELNLAPRVQNQYKTSNPFIS